MIHLLLVVCGELRVHAHYGSAGALGSCTCIAAVSLLGEYAASSTKGSNVLRTRNATRGSFPGVP